MLLILFCALWGSLLSLILCAPYGYYPLFLIILSSSIAIYTISKKFFKFKVRYYCFYSFFAFVACYCLCSYIVFKPANFHFADFSKIEKGKKAIIFYCEGEMEKYTPYYANGFINDKCFILKPFYAANVKRIYKIAGVNTKNKELLEIALQVKNSILNYKPYYFYISFADYAPDIMDSVYSAISDGCSQITIINYSSNTNLEKKLSKKLNTDKFNSLGVKIIFTESVCSTNIFEDYIVSQITNMPNSPEAILLISDINKTSSRIKYKLMDLGYKDSDILISQDLEGSINTFKKNGVTNLLYVNLDESSSGIESDIITPSKIDKFTDKIKISGIKSWGFDKKLIKATIDVFVKSEKEEPELEK